MAVVGVLVVVLGAAAGEVEAPLPPMETELEEQPSLAMRALNPLSGLHTLPVTFAYDRTFMRRRDGEGDGFTVRLDPRVTFSLGPEWNLVWRSLVQLVARRSGPTGLADVYSGVFVAPVRPAFGRLWWGVGPAVSLPMATHPALGRSTMGVGLNAILLTQFAGWTVGTTLGHLQSVGFIDRIHTTLVQPFVSFTDETGWSLRVDCGAKRNGATGEWLVPVSFQVDKLVEADGRPVSLGAAVTLFPVGPVGAPDIGLELTVRLVFDDPETQGESGG